MCDMDLELMGDDIVEGYANDNQNFPVWQEPRHNTWAAGWKAFNGNAPQHYLDHDELPSPIFSTDSPDESPEMEWDRPMGQPGADADARECLSPCGSMDDDAFEWWGSMQGIAERLDSLP